MRLLKAVFRCAVDEKSLPPQCEHVTKLWFGRYRSHSPRWMLREATGLEGRQHRHSSCPACCSLRHNLVAFEAFVRVAGSIGKLACQQALEGAQSPSFKTLPLPTFLLPTSRIHRHRSILQTHQLDKIQPNSLTHLITMSNTVHVKGISGQTSEKEVRDFFSFW